MPNYISGARPSYHRVINILIILSFLSIIYVLSSVRMAQAFDCENTTGIDKEQCRALVAIYDSTVDGTQCNVTTKWLTSKE